MADRWAVANGNWSNTATWNGGTLPTSSDDVYADGRTVTIDISVTVLSVRTTQRSGGTVGGSFALNAGQTLTANVFAGSTTCVVFSALSPNSATVIGNCTGGTSGSFVNGCSLTGTGTLNIIGNCLGGTVNYAYGASITAGTLNITGNCIAADNSAFQASGAGNRGPSAVLNIVGNCIGCSFSTNQYNVGVINASTGTVNITGNAIGGSAADGVYNEVTGTVNITGTCTGGSSNNAAGARNVAAGTMTINGTAIGGTGANCFGATNDAGGAMSVLRAKGNGFGLGSVGLGATPGVRSNLSSSLTSVQEIEFGDLGQSPTLGPIRLTDLTTNVAVMYRVGLSKKTLVDSATSANYPAVGNVRLGTSYNFGNNTGTLAVPNPNQVAVGVATDNTVGTAVLTAQNVRDAVGLASANLDVQLEKITKNSSLIPGLL